MMIALTELAVWVLYALLFGTVLVTLVVAIFAFYDYLLDRKAIRREKRLRALAYHWNHEWNHERWLDASGDKFERRTWRP